MDEAEESLQEPLTEEVRKELMSVLVDLKGNMEKVQEHGSRADGIVGSMLEHSQTTRGKQEPCDINRLLKEYIAVAYRRYQQKHPNEDPNKPQ